MSPGENPVDENICRVVDSSEIQIDILSVPLFRDADVPAVPYAVDKIGVPNAGQFALRTERHGNFLTEASCLEKFPVHTGFSEIEFEIPCPVEVDPFLSLELRPRVFRPWQFFC